MASIEEKDQLKFQEDHFFKAMREKKRFTDVVFICDGGEQVEAHRLILSAYSPYFRKMFLGDFTESSTKQVDFSYVNKDILLTILDFIYLHRVTIKPGESIDELIQIYQVSHLFEVVGLSSCCWKLILKNLKQDSWLKIWELVLLHGNDEEVRKVLYYILENLLIIVGNNYFLLTYSQMKRLLEKINENKIPMEEDFLEAIIRWSKKTNQPKAQSQEIFLQINFHFISREFMTDLLEKEKYLFQDSTFKQFFKLQFLPTLKTNSELYSRFPLKLFFFRRIRIIRNLKQYLKGELDIFDCEKKCFCKNISYCYLPFNFSSNITPIQCGSDIYIIGGFPNNCDNRSESKSFFLYEWKTNKIVQKPFLLEEVLNPFTCVSKNHIYVISSNATQYFSLTEEKWFGSKYENDRVVALASVKDVAYLLCSKSSTDYYYLMTVNKLDFIFHSITPIPKWEEINRNHVTVYKNHLFVLLSNYEWYIFDPETPQWKIKKTSIPRDYIMKNCICFADNFLMFYNNDDDSLHRFHTNNVDIKKIMDVYGSRDEVVHWGRKNFLSRAVFIYKS